MPHMDRLLWCIEDVVFHIPDDHDDEMYEERDTKVGRHR